MLFIKLPNPDRQRTQLAYKIKFFPWAMLTPAAKELIRNHKEFYLSKELIEQHATEDKNFLIWEGRRYAIQWVFNNLPTEQEWLRSKPTRVIRVELRNSPAIPEYGVAILSFELPHEKLAAYAAGEL